MRNIQLALVASLVMALVNVATAAHAGAQCAQARQMAATSCSSPGGAMFCGAQTLMANQICSQEAEEEGVDDRGSSSSYTPTPQFQPPTQTYTQPSAARHTQRVAPVNDCVQFGFPERGYARNICDIAIDVTWKDQGHCDTGCGISIQPRSVYTSGTVNGRVTWIACPKPSWVRGRGTPSDPWYCAP